MLKRFFSRRNSTGEQEAPPDEAPAPHRPGGLGPGLLWLLAFLFSASVIGAVGVLAYRHLQSQAGTQSEAVLRLQADAVAAELSVRLQGLTELVERAAAQPALGAVMASGDPAAIAAQADAIAGTLPGALRVRLFAPGAYAPDETQSPRLGYAGIGLARQAESGGRPQVEIHWLGAPDQHIAVARAIGGPQQPAAGVLLASIDSGVIRPWLTAALPAGGYAEVRQIADGQSVIATGGDAARSGTAPSVTVTLAGAAWELALWLPQGAPLSAEARTAFIIPFVAATGVLGLLFAVLGIIDSRLVRSDLVRLVTHVFDLLQRKRAHGHTVRLRAFREAVEVLDENIRLPTRHEAPPPEAARPEPVPEDPLFQHGGISVEELDQPAEGDEK